MIGRIYGKLTVLKRDPLKKRGQVGQDKLPSNCSLLRKLLTRYLKKETHNT